MPELVLPLTDTGRKYGYIIWPKSKDEDLREVFGDAEVVTLLPPTGVEKRATVDWKHHRVSIGYSATRSLPSAIKAIKLSTTTPGRIEVSFI